MRGVLPRADCKLLTCNADHGALVSGGGVLKGLHMNKGQQKNQTFLTILALDLLIALKSSGLLTIDSFEIQSNGGHYKGLMRVKLGMVPNNGGIRVLKGLH